MKVSKIMKMLPVMLVACMLLSSVSAFAAVAKPEDLTAVADKVTVVVSGMQQNEEVAIMVYDTNEAYTSPADVAAADILYIDQAPATVLDSGDGATTYGVTFQFYLKDGASELAKTVAIGSATASAVTYETFEIKKTASYTPGDADGSGEVDVDDIMCIAKSMAGFTVTINVQAADVDASGEIDVDDIMLIAKSMAGFDVKLLPGNVKE